MLRLDTPGHARIEWIVISNMTIDFDFLLEQAPELYSVPRAVVFYEGGGGMSMQLWSSATTVDYVVLKPSDPPRSRTNPLPYKEDYGVHHSKFFLVGFSDGTLRVVIHTANLIGGDNIRKVNAAYIQDFPRKQSIDEPASDFENDLVDYLESYRYSAKNLWGSHDRCMQTLPEVIRNYDFSSALAVLIPSIPGRRYLNKESAFAVGQLKLRRAVLKYTKRADESSILPIVCQFSSLGALSDRFLRDFLNSADSNRPRKSVSVPAGTSLAGRLKIVWPTADEIITSVEGVVGGTALPGRTRNVSRAIVKNLYHKWRSATPTAWDMGRNCPHIKSFFQYDLEGTGMQWFAISSHNISTYAWGDLQKNNTQIKIGNWELGVFISPRTLDCEGYRLVPLGQQPPGPNELGVPLPYQLHPEPYGPDDEPWDSDRIQEWAEREAVLRAQGLLRSEFDDRNFVAVPQPTHIPFEGTGRAIGGEQGEPLSAEELRRRRLAALAGGQ
jgi:tyrosyl-DNA phosphodiesterase-1